MEELNQPGYPTPISNEPTKITAYSGLDPSIARDAAQETALIKCQYDLAVMKPRNTELVRQKIIKQCQIPSFARTAEYALPRGGKRIVGDTIRFAEAMVSAWGNMYIGSRVIHEDDESQRIRVMVIDCETGNREDDEFTIKKTVERRDKKGREVVSERANSYGEKVYIVKCTEDEMLAKINARRSKAKRTIALNYIPADIREEARNQCRLTCRNAEAKDPTAWYKELADKFAAINIDAEQLQAYLGHEISKCDRDEWRELQGIYNHIQDGSMRWKEVLAEKIGNKEEKKPTSKEKNKKTSKDLGKQAASDMENA